MSIYQMSEAVAVSGQIQPEHVAQLAEHGFKAIICNRPDGEEFGQPPAADIAQACEVQDIAFHYIPVDKSGLTMEMVESFRDAVAASDGPVFAYCRSGQRSSVLWQASGSP